MSLFLVRIPLALLIVAGCDSGGVVAPAADLAVAAPDLGTIDDLGTPPQIDGGGADLVTLPVIELEWIPRGSAGLEGAIIDASPDETGNVWAVSDGALFIRRGGASSFRKYTNADGLHVSSSIKSVAGGGMDDGWVGLEGHETDYPDLDPPDLKRLGKAEHVWLNRDNTLRTLHYAEMHNDGDAAHWETRTAYRLLYVHEGPAAGHLFLGGNHGVVHVFDDKWGDHIHVELYLEPQHVMSFGLWNGLAVDPATGELWTCGKTACGLEHWIADPHQWAVAAHYRYAFTVFSGDHGLEEPSGYREDHVGTALAPDGTAYFLSKTDGLAAWKPNGFNYEQIKAVPVPSLNTPVDLAADPDGTLWVADARRLIRFDPGTGMAQTIVLPSGDLRRLYLDNRVNPRALYVSTGGGLAIYRGK